MERPFVAENAKERERLRSLVERLTDKELSLPLGNGWTIAVALALGICHFGISEYYFWCGNGRKAVLNHHR